ncbi:hypothetical protein CERZMDRAFT_114764 [Cercospora zeae-maydis SCOH1-5]|uniref:phosphoserine phosphatase n=1 Tax=Cercospora zeae-maydis SCOH1-5 TaxID=717836 RepID=A0A6A6F3E6_9PEZI|nr:hypothetical protein CERZMDRAFT_114764 [Cercospora zeae-maydis SCOH1-5]
MSGIVALIFAKDDQRPQWDQTYGSIVEHYKRYSGDLDGVAIAQSRVLATRTPTLRECKDFTDRKEVQALQREHNIEIVVQPGDLYAAHRKPGLAVFDMDSTLIQQEVIDELARAVGLYDQVAAITEAAMRGEEPYVDFEASLRARVALLKGVPDTIWQELREGIITFTPGAQELLRVLVKSGWKTAILSGGFTPLANWVKETLGMHYIHANHLVSDLSVGQLTGELEEGKPIIHGHKKRELLLEIAKENGISLHNVIAVGDGSNDLPMMEVAGFGVAFNAKPKVQAAAPSKLNSKIPGL